jgi:hypothetical protein
MIRTVLSSFFFLLPIYISFVKQDVIGLFLFTIGMGLSIANHSHSFHLHLHRKHFFNRIDVWYMHILACYTVIHGLSRIHPLYVASIAVLNLIIYKCLGEGLKEDYNKVQKNGHVFFHIIGISSFTLLRYA